VSRRRVSLRAFAAALLRNLVPYALASVAAAVTVVASVHAIVAAQGTSMGLDNILIATVYACVATFVFAFPASALFIGIGEWRRLGTSYHVAAGFLAATLSWLAVLTETYVSTRRGDGSPFLRFEDLEMLLSVGIGGAVGGLVFVRIRNALVRRLGDLGLQAADPEWRHR